MTRQLGESFVELLKYSSIDLVGVEWYYRWQCAESIYVGIVKMGLCNQEKLSSMKQVRQWLKIKPLSFTSIAIRSGEEIRFNIKRIMSKHANSLEV